jgi:hypothetical protein
MPFIRLRPLSLALAALPVVATAAPALAQHPAAPSTAHMQGNDEQSWINDAHMHAFYDTALAAFANGPAQVDVDAFERKSYAIFRAFGASRGMDPAKMQDHLKLIPRQVVQIARDDPKVLDSYKNFVDAIFGPQ